MSKEQDFNALDLARKVIELADANPEKVYKREVDPHGYASCSYVHEGDVPGCIVGHALIQLGVTPKAIRKAGVNNSGVFSAMNALGIRDVSFFDPKAGCYIGLSGSIGVAQSNQDAGFTWGSAVLRLRQAVALAEAPVAAGTAVLG